MSHAIVQQSPLLGGVKGIRHAFFSRQGGVSKGLYASLNCGCGSDDDADAIKENRRIAASYLRSGYKDIVTVHQIHSAQAIVVEAPFVKGRAALGDALVTQTPGLAIGVLTADCTPVLFVDPEAKIVAAAHAGWRGAVSGILEETVGAMETIGANRSRICAVIGPAIHQSNYQVGLEFEADFLHEDPDNRQFFTRPAAAAKPHFDLPGFCYTKLQSTGIGFVDAIERCTYADDSLFFSYRRATHRSEPDYGRQMSAIVIA